MRKKKSISNTTNHRKTDESFIFWGGNLQQQYEEYRQLSFAGKRIEAFEVSGMGLFAQATNGAQSAFVMSRSRAAVRSGSFDFTEFLFENLNTEVSL